MKSNVNAGKTSITTAAQNTLSAETRHKQSRCVADMLVLDFGIPRIQASPRASGLHTIGSGRSLMQAHTVSWLGCMNKPVSGLLCCSQDIVGTNNLQCAAGSFHLPVCKSDFNHELVRTLGSTLQLRGRSIEMTTQNELRGRR